MVQLHVPEAEFVRQQKQLKAGRSQLDEDIIGAQACRIEIPLADPVFLRYAADQLRGFAERMDSHARMTGLNDRQILMLTQREARELSKRLWRRARGKDVTK